jgi:NADH/NAD ratio-sensing transcriptional regulator Rex
MDIQKLAENSLSLLKELCPIFPKSGIIAGGSLGNLIWEQISGNTAIVNDIDVFQFNKKLDITDAGELNTNTNDGKKMFYRSQEKIYWKDYTGLCEGSKTKSFYVIEGTENDGLLNIINYSSTSEDPYLIIDSFDINCTQIGYDIESNKFFWTEDFETFLKTGQIKLTNLGSPAHSAIRILKKRDELKAHLDELEIKLCAYVIGRGMAGITRRYFSNKYFDISKKYSKELSEYFNISEVKEISDFINESKKIDINIYTLILNDTYQKEVFKEDFLYKDAVNKIWHCNDFLFYIRNRERDIFNFKIWNTLQPLYNYDGYVDSEVSDENIDMLRRLIENIPNSIRNLQGMNITQQINLVKKLYEEFSEDITIAFAILDKKKLEYDIVLDSETKLLLELSVRKEIVNNTYDIKKIMGIVEDSSNYFDDMIF